jgi:hypothetical protein
MIVTKENRSPWRGSRETGSNCADFVLCCLVPVDEPAAEHGEERRENDQNEKEIALVHC